MDNASIAAHFAMLAKVMELHQENVFKIRSYSNVSEVIASYPSPLAAMSLEHLQEIPGIGNAIAAKIVQLNTIGHLDLLQKYLSQTPQGVIDLMQLKGLGVKKIWILWKELGIESMGELEYACKENRLLTLKGFGEKTQKNILEQIAFLQQHNGKILLHKAERWWQELYHIISEQYPEAVLQFVGALRLRENVISHVEIVAKNIAKVQVSELFSLHAITFDEEEKTIKGSNPVLWTIYFLEENEWAKWVFEKSAEPNHVSAVRAAISDYDTKYYYEEKDIYHAAQLPYIAPELRSSLHSLEEAMQWHKDLIQFQDIKGVIHTHTKYSDGQHAIAEMADECLRLGYEYLAISDHSKSAFYANGLKEGDVIRQHQEIDRLNAKGFGREFTILKSIESDILSDGSLDYDADMLCSFDVVIASIHSLLKMDEEKATSRLIKAIENPYTHILGHLSGRLLLSRKGYPLDMVKIIDACAANKVAIELNANPHRLDIDAKWLTYCMEKNVLIAINPDAHHINGIADIKYGIYAARRGGLQKNYCINTYNKEDFLHSLKK